LTVALAGMANSLAWRTRSVVLPPWGMSGDRPVNGDLAGALRRLAEQAGEFRLKAHAESQQ
jgi:hypothetical protein